MPQPRNSLPLLTSPPQYWPQGESDFEKNARKVSQITAVAYVITRAIPGIPGKVFGKVAIAVIKDAGTGKVIPTTATLGVLLPSPFGFSNPRIYGLPPNYWLPEGATVFVPEFADFLGLGFPQQRELDAIVRRGEYQQRRVVVVRSLALETDETIRLLNSVGGTSPRIEELRASSPFSILELRGAAREEHIRRLTMQGHIQGGVDPVTGKPVRDGTINPNAIDPPADAAKRNRRAKRGIGRELVHERADP